MKKKILVVGGAGYVGGVIVDLLLLKKSYDVTVFDNLLYENSYRKDCNFINGDVRDRKFYRKSLNKYDVIVFGGTWFLNNPFNNKLYSCGTAASYLVNKHYYKNSK